MPGPDETTEPDDAGDHEVPDDLLELFEAIAASEAGLIPGASE